MLTSTSGSYSNLTLERLSVELLRLREPTACAERFLEGAWKEAPRLVLACEGSRMMEGRLLGSGSFTPDCLPRASSSLLAFSMCSRILMIHKRLHIV